MGKGARLKKQHEQERIDKERVEYLMKMLEASKFTLKEKVKIRFIKTFKRGRLNRVCAELYGFRLNSQRRGFRKIIRDTYTEGILLHNFADFHLLGITKCAIMDNNWKNFLTANGEIKR